MSSPENDLRVIQAMAGGAYGGAETFFVTLSCALKRAGTQTQAVIRPNELREEQLSACHVPVTTVPYKRYFDFTTRKGIRETAKTFGADIVMTWMGRASQMCPKGPFTHVARLGGYYDMKYFRNCDHLICITPDLVRHCLDGGWPEDRVHFIPNFPLVDELPALDRATLDTPDDKPLLVALARLHQNKAIDVLLHALVGLEDTYLWIAGEGPERVALENLAQELGVTERVRFLGWRTDKGALLRAADICVFPSRIEPNGTVVVEAWAYGTPLVVTASDGPAWIARGDEDAVLVPIDDPAALAAGIQRVLDDPKFAAQLTQNGLKRVAQEFSEESVVNRYIALYEKIRPTREVRL